MGKFAYRRRSCGESIIIHNERSQWRLNYIGETCTKTKVRKGGSMVENDSFESDGVDFGCRLRR